MKVEINYKTETMKKLFIVTFIISAILFSCKKDNLPMTGTTQLKFRLTDAPGPFDKVNINITGAEVIIDDKTISLDVKTGIYNLLDFVNGKDTLIVDQRIPAGEISQFRLILGSENTVKTSTGTFDLKTPSAQQSGLKFNVHATFLEGVAYEYIIDFDAARSVVETGNHNYILKPVIKVFTKAVSGAIKGAVYPAAARPLIYAISAQLDSFSTYSDTISGSYMFRGLTEGTYKLKFLPLSPFNDSTLNNISVKTNTVTNIDTLRFK